MRTRFFFLLLVLLPIGVLGQRIPEIEKQYFEDNKPKNFTIWAAKYASQSYLMCKKLAFGTDASQAFLAGDSAARFRDLAIVAVDSALANIPDSNQTDSIRVALEYLQVAVDELREAETAIQQVFFAPNLDALRETGRAAMFAAGNGAVDCYTASLYISGKLTEEEEEEEIEEEIVDLIKVKRLEVDESVFTGLADSYENKISGVDEQIEAITDGLFDVPDDQLDAVNAEIDSLSKVREMLVNRLEGTNRRLKDVSDALADELSRTLQPTAVGRKKGEFSMTAGTGEVEYDPELPPGLVYQVQVGYFSNETLPSFVDRYSPIYGFRISNKYVRYSTGLLYSYFDAAAARAALRPEVPDAFVTAYYDNKKISTSQAIRLERKQNLLEKKE